MPAIRHSYLNNTIQCYYTKNYIHDSFPNRYNVSFSYQNVFDSFPMVWVLTLFYVLSAFTDSNSKLYNSNMSESGIVFIQLKTDS